MKTERPDPLCVLYTTKDPAQAAWAVAELRRCGFTNAEEIAADFGWRRHG